MWQQPARKLPSCLPVTNSGLNSPASIIPGIEMLYSTLLDPQAQSEGRAPQNLDNLELSYITSQWDVETVGSRSSPITLNPGLGVGQRAKLLPLHCYSSCVTTLSLTAAPSKTTSHTVPCNLFRAQKRVIRCGCASGRC